MSSANTVLPSSAAYYAPQTPGTYYVTVSMTQVCCWFDTLTKTAQTAITVTE